MKNLQKEARMEKVNGIIISGKVYKAVRGECKDCDLQEQCKDNDFFNNLCNYFEGYQIKYPRIFRHSPELTERLKGGEK